MTIARRWNGSVLPWCVLGVVAAVVVAPARADESARPPLLRIFLTDGRSVTSYGEYARVGDQVVFSLPLGDANGQTGLHLSTLPAARVDWAATEAYRESARAAQYAATRGDEDFAVLTGEVAALLNDVAHTPNAGTQLAMAESARQALAQWPVDHFGYRADEVRQMLALLDEVVADLRAAHGERRFDLSLVADLSAGPHVPLLPAPSLQESIQQALVLADLAPSPADRVSLLRSAVALLDRHASDLPAAWSQAVRPGATRGLAEEVSLDGAYADLRARALDSATRYAARADVRAVERVRRDVRERDARLGGRRPADMEGLLAALDEKLDAARRLRLARDQWTTKAPALHSWQGKVRRPLDDLLRERPLLEDIRTLAGPASDQLRRLDQRLAALEARLRGVSAPADARAAHAVILSAVQLASNAARTRQAAITSGDLRRAWDASAAAAGALMLTDRARAEIQRATQPPKLQ